MKFVVVLFMFSLSIIQYKCENIYFKGMDTYDILDSNYKELSNSDDSKSNKDINSKNNNDNNNYSSFMELGMQTTTKSLSTLKSQAEMAERESDKIIDYFKAKLEKETKERNLRALRFKQNDLFKNNELARLTKKRTDLNIPSNINEMMNTIKME